MKIIDHEAEIIKKVDTLVKLLEQERSKPHMMKRSDNLASLLKKLRLKLIDLKENFNKEENFIPKSIEIDEIKDILEKIPNANLTKLGEILVGHLQTLIITLVITLAFGLTMYGFGDAIGYDLMLYSGVGAGISTAAYCSIQFADYKGFFHHNDKYDNVTKDGNDIINYIQTNITNTP